MTSGVGRSMTAAPQGALEERRRDGPAQRRRGGRQRQHAGRRQRRYEPQLVGLEQAIDPGQHELGRAEGAGERLSQRRVERRDVEVGHGRPFHGAREEVRGRAESASTQTGGLPAGVSAQL